MRTYIVDTVRPDGLKEMRISQSIEFFEALVMLGLNAQELIERGIYEFLSADGTQYQITFCAPNVFVLADARKVANG